MMDEIIKIQHEIEHLYDGVEKLFDGYDQFNIRLESIEKDIKLIINHLFLIIKLIEKGAI
jgi:hypothetical protein